jgi:HEAT repeats
VNSENRRAIVQTLCTLLQQSPDARLRIKAAESLGILSVEESIPLLCQVALQDADLQVCLAAVDALVVISRSSLLEIMNIDRLAALETNLTMLYEQLGGQEKAKITAEEAEKVRIEQKIRETKKELRQYEQEYVQVLAQQVERQDLPESVAELVVDELVDEIEIFQPQAQNDEIKALVQQVLTELRKPEIPAAAKLKVAIPIVPGIVTYELEGDTRGVVQRLFPTLVKVYQGLRGAQTPKK